MGRKSASERFWEKVDVRGSDECWEWMATKTSDGYGRFKPSGCSAPVPAHRVAWELANGRKMIEECAMHSCDNPKCCNPSHIEPGTKSQNLTDAYARGLSTPMRGELNPRAKLSKRDIEHIRGMFAEGMNNTEIAARFSVNHSTISLIRSGKTWANG